MPARVMPRPPDDDPLSIVTAPPLNESQAEKEARMGLERQARLVSDAIDCEIEKQKIADKRVPKPIKVLLLGQSESGKSTTLKNFQLMYEPQAFRRELGSWRAIIQLNVVRSIHVILDAISRLQPRVPDIHEASSSSSSMPSPPPQLFGLPPSLDAELLHLKMRLRPLMKIEEILVRRLTPSDSGEFSITPLYTSNMSNFEKVISSKEVAVNSTMPWKEVFNKFIPGGRESFESEQVIDWDDPLDPGRVLHECAEDMKRLWNHSSVHELLERQNLRLEEMGGFFLDCLDEVTSVRYVPTADHILRARIKTLGVSEHRVKMNPGAGVGRDWRIFDVGGHRSLRHAWVPYFDDMDAIIFLVPISAFDQVLEEAPKVNRLEDSVILWTTIVSNPLLKDTNLILFLNKCDIMKAKLASGIKLKDYVVSFVNRPNDFETASNYLRKKFAGILKENSPVPRGFYCHFTCVTDTNSTKKVIANIRDMLMRENLKNSTLLL